VFKKVSKVWHEPTLQYFLYLFKLCPTEPRSYFGLFNFKAIRLFSLLIFDGDIFFDESVSTSADYCDDFLLLVLRFSFVLFLFYGFLEEGLFSHSAGEVFDVGIKSGIELVFKVFGLGFEKLKVMLFVLFLIFVDEFLVLLFPKFMVLFDLCIGLFFFEVFLLNVLIKLFRKVEFLTLAVFLSNRINDYFSVKDKHELINILNRESAHVFFLIGLICVKNFELFHHGDIFAFLEVFLLLIKNYFKSI
jgi:hypothetical protein